MNDFNANLYHTQVTGRDDHVMIGVFFLLNFSLQTFILMNMIKTLWKYFACE